VTDEQAALREGLRRVAVALAQAEIPYALGGSYAAWARGAPEPDHDADFVVRPEDIERAKVAIDAAGLEVEDPTEDWLFKAFHEGQLVDILFRVCGEPVDDELLDGADEVEVLAIRMPVMSATDLMSTKMRVLGEHDLDMGRLLPVARALREQIDWDRVRTEIEGHPYAMAFQYLLDQLGITTPPE
jgi:hypothetical protein